VHEQHRPAAQLDGVRRLDQLAAGRQGAGGRAQRVAVAVVAAEGA
jgi:hypothetical protein